ncbi:MAG: lytic murein transglycosylase B [Gammaproteobacteria bacterium]|nr:lytic murein transglycosylase B [Gammaproteobacteria bacterium]
MIQHYKKLLLAAAFVCTHTAVANNDASLAEKEKQDFILEMSQKHGFDQQFLTKTLDQAKVKQSILDAISRPAEKTLTWSQYRNIFIKPKRIEGGVQFWKENEADLNKAYQQYGVPPEIITAIIGVETLYGKHTGGYRVLDALTTLGFHYPPRSKFFRKELLQFLLLTREEKVDPTEPTGSYAGAMGKPQFIPSSYRHYAIDFDNDGKRDIWNNNTDVIGSVASYFSRHGWRRDRPVTVPASNVDNHHNEMVKAGMKPSIPVERLREAGIDIDEQIRPEQLSSLVELMVTDGKEYWAGLHNFYVITRYNHSNMYAMAVYQLSQEILKARKSTES